MYLYNNTRYQTMKDAVWASYFDAVGIESEYLLDESTFYLPQMKIYAKVMHEGENLVELWRYMRSIVTEDTSKWGEPKNVSAVLITDMPWEFKKRQTENGIIQNGPAIPMGTIWGKKIKTRITTVDDGYTGFFMTNSGFPSFIVLNAPKGIHFGGDMITSAQSELIKTDDDSKNWNEAMKKAYHSYKHDIIRVASDKADDTIATREDPKMAIIQNAMYGADKPEDYKPTHIPKHAGTVTHSEAVKAMDDNTTYVPRHEEGNYQSRRTVPAGVQPPTTDAPSKNELPKQPEMSASDLIMSLTNRQPVSSKAQQHPTNEDESEEGHGKLLRYNMDDSMGVDEKDDFPFDFSDGLENDDKVDAKEPTVSNAIETSEASRKEALPMLDNIPDEPDEEAAHDVSTSDVSEAESSKTTSKATVEDDSDNEPEFAMPEFFKNLNIDLGNDDDTAEAKEAAENTKPIDDKASDTGDDSDIPDMIDSFEKGSSLDEAISQKEKEAKQKIPDAETSNDSDDNLFDFLNFGDEDAIPNLDEFLNSNSDDKKGENKPAVQPDKPKPEEKDEVAPSMAELKKQADALVGNNESSSKAPLNSSAKAATSMPDISDMPGAPVELIQNHTSEETDDDAEHKEISKKAKSGKMRSFLDNLFFEYVDDDSGDEQPARNKKERDKKPKKKAKQKQDASDDALDGLLSANDSGAINNSSNSKVAQETAANGKIGASNALDNWIKVSLIPQSQINKDISVTDLLLIYNRMTGCSCNAHDLMAALQNNGYISQKQDGHTYFGISSASSSLNARVPLTYKGEPSQWATLSSAKAIMAKLK